MRNTFGATRLPKPSEYGVCLGLRMMDAECPPVEFVVRTEGIRGTWIPSAPLPELPFQGIENLDEHIHRA